MLFSKYNTGAPRCTKGKGSPRGPNTFVAVERATFSVSGVVEVAFKDAVKLPESTQIGDSPVGPWRTIQDID
jgi:hypothetical protein